MADEKMSNWDKANQAGQLAMALMPLFQMFLETISGIVERHNKKDEAK